MLESMLSSASNWRKKSAAKNREKSEQLLKEQQSNRSLSIQGVDQRKTSFVMDQEKLKNDLHRSKRKASVLNKLHHATSFKLPN